MSGAGEHALELLDEMDESRDAGLGQEYSPSALPDAMTYPSIIQALVGGRTTSSAACAYALLTRMARC